MDVSCERCKTEYEFDDARINEAGVTVKCTTCGHVFKVKKAGPSSDGDLPRTEVGIPAFGGDKPREWKVRQATGNVFSFRELTTLQKWIVERKVSRDDEISLTGENWKRLGNIAELASFFMVVDEAQKAAQLAALQAQGMLRYPTTPPPSSMAANTAVLGPSPHMVPTVVGPAPGAQTAVAPPPGVQIISSSSLPRVPTNPEFPAVGGMDPTWGGPSPAPQGQPPGWSAPPAQNPGSIGLTSLISGEFVAQAGSLPPPGMPAAKALLPPPPAAPPLQATLPPSEVPYPGQAYPGAISPQVPQGQLQPIQLYAMAPPGAPFPQATEPVRGGFPVEHGRKEGSFAQTMPTEQFDVDFDVESAAGLKKKKGMGAVVWVLLGVAVLAAGGFFAYQQLLPPPKVEPKPEVVQVAPKEEPVVDAGMVEAAKPTVDAGVVAQAAGTEAGGDPVKVSTKAEPVRDFDYYMAQGDKLREREKAAAALEAYGKAAELNPESAEPVAGKGLALLDLGRAVQAEAAFNQALRLNGRYGVAIMGLAETFRSLGNKEKAIEYYQKYLDDVPNGAEAPVARSAIKRLQEQ